MSYLSDSALCFDNRDKQLSVPDNGLYESVSQALVTKSDNPFLPQSGHSTTGNGSSGTVVFYQQAHRSPHSTPSDITAAKSVQWAIYQQLVRDNITELFTEARDETVTPDDPKRDEKLFTAEVSKAFPHGVPDSFDQLTASQSDLLYQLGADTIYAALNLNVTLHRTISADQESRVDRKLASINLAYALDRYQRLNGDSNFGDATNELLNRRFTALQHYREAAAANELLQHLGTLSPDTLGLAPGKVGLVYGALHRFDDKLFSGLTKNRPPEQQSAAVPKVVTQSWPELYGESASVAAQSIIEERSPTRQYQIVRGASALSLSVVPHLRSVEALFEALPKLESDPYRCTDSDELRASLVAAGLRLPMTFLEVPDYERLIDQLLAEQRGPFAMMQPEPFNRRVVAKMNSKQVLATIRSVTHPATQREIVRTAASVPHEALSYIRTDAGWLLALPKLVVNRKLYKDNPQLLQFYLQTAAPSERVSEAVASHYRARTGPFVNFPKGSFKNQPLLSR